MLAAILPAAFVIGIGMLFMDLVPLQEGMRCADYDNITSCPEIFWSQDYHSARTKFRALSYHAGAEVTPWTVTQDYTIDIAVIKGRADRVLIHASGTHGVEGYVGSAIQAKILTDWNETAVEVRPTVVFVHAVNPYGMAKMRRFNEENVDLNRNHLTSSEWEMVKKRDPNIAGFDDFWSALKLDRAPNLVDRYLVVIKALRFVVLWGLEACKRAIVSGQYHNPTAIYYGGTETQKSIEILEEALEPIMEAATDAIFMDVHSGLGPTGVDTFMVNTPKDAEECTDVWSDARIAQIGEAAHSGYELMVGGISIRKMFPNVRIIEVAEEFGTVAPIIVARNLLLENEAYHHARDSFLHEQTRMWVRDAFYPQSISFKTSVLSYGVDAFDRANKYLMEKK